MNIFKIYFNTFRVAAKQFAGAFVLAAVCFALCATSEVQGDSGVAGKEATAKTVLEIFFILRGR